LNSAYVRLSLGVSANNPTVVAAAALAGGTDDRANAVDADWQVALDRFAKTLGPGQVSFPGRTTSAAHAQLLQHAADNGRVAICDAPDTPTVATLTTLAQADRNNGRFGALFAPWAVVPGVVPNTTRTVPYSAIEAGMIARNDVTLNPNVPAAGRRGESFYASALSQTWTDAQRQTLNSQGVNVAVNRNGDIRTYGYRSLTNPATDASWLDFGNARLVMFITANGEEILEDHLFDEIDGSGLLFGRVKGRLTAMMNELYTQGALFGATPGEAFAVVVDTSNNTPTTIANHELHAAVAFRASEMAEWIQLTLSKVPVNQPIA
jgi:phage tail sheath protein FI